jgi:hypothetical protein
MKFNQTMINSNPKTNAYKVSMSKLLMLAFVCFLSSSTLCAQQSVHTSGGEALGPGGMKGHSISNKIKSGDQNPH